MSFGIHSLAARFAEERGVRFGRRAGAARGSSAPAGGFAAGRCLSGIK